MIVHAVTEAAVTYRDISPGGSEAIKVFGFVIIGVAALISRLVYANYKKYEYNSKRAWTVFLILGLFSVPLFLFSAATSAGETAMSISQNISQKYENVRVEKDEITPVVEEYRKATGKPLEIKDSSGNVYHLIATDSKEPHLELPEGSSAPAPLVKNQG